MALTKVTNTMLDLDPVLNTTGTNNYAIGIDALAVNDVESDSIAIGTNTLKAFLHKADVARGSAETLPEADNIAIGTNSMKKLVTGSWNIAMGMDSMANQTIGNNNTAIGHSALFNSTTGQSHVAVGIYALTNNTTSNANTAVGSAAALKNTTGENIVAVGSLALAEGTTGDNNVGVGNSALYYNVTGERNVAVGTNALERTTASNCVGVGDEAASKSTGKSNTAIGSATLNYVTVGESNTALGAFAGTSINFGPVTAQSSTFLGTGATSLIQTSINQIAVGYEALTFRDNTAQIGNNLIQTFGFGPYKILWWNDAFPNGTFKKGDRIFNTAPASGGATPSGWVNTQSGDNLTAPCSVAGTSTSGSATIACAAPSGTFTFGQLITVTAGFAVLTDLTILSIVDGVSITVDRTANASGALTINKVAYNFVVEGLIP